MNIAIADRSVAFSHAFGREVMIPCTTWKVCAFPTALFFSDCSSDQKRTFFLDLQGPICPFTVELDLEKSCIRIFGQAKLGYFRFLIKLCKEKLIFFVEKAPSDGIFYRTEQLGENIFYKEPLVLAIDCSLSAPLQERLFLGNNQCKDLAKIRIKKELKQILPLWFHLGQQISFLKKEKELGGVFDLMQAIEKKVAVLDRNLEEEFVALYLAGFTEGFVPRGRDEEFQGILSLESISKDPLSLLSRGAALIRSLFFQERKDQYLILPCLPPSFVSGRMKSIVTSRGTTIDLEWVKQKMRKMTVISNEDGPVYFIFPSCIYNCRIRTSLKDKGYLVKNGEAFVLQKGKTFWLDRFFK